MYKKTVLIFGVSSFVGANIAESLCSDYRVVGTYFNTILINKNFFTIKCDITNPTLVKGIINLARPDIVIYCVGEKNIDVCHNSPKRSDSLNANGVFNVINALDAFNAKFFYFSSTMIYSGADKEHDEEDSPISNTVYGSSVASAEFYIQKSYLNYVIMRLPILFGKESNLKNSNILSRIQHSLLKKEDIELDDSIYYGYLSISTLVKSIKNCIENNITNQKINLVSTDVLTKYEFSRLVCDIFNYNNSYLSKKINKLPVTSTISNMKLRDGKLCFSLSSSKAQEVISYNQKSTKDMLIDFKNNDDSSDKETKKKTKLKLI
jgi:dTDP-4-dehydrorhamnose reductase